MRRLAACLACLVLLARASFAEPYGSLGLRGGEVGVSGAWFDTGPAASSLGAAPGSPGWKALNAAHATVDIALTAHHGFQGDLGFADTPGGGIGTLGAHLYLEPDARHRYGLFARLSDRRGDALAWASVGAEGMAALGPRTTLEYHAGLGAANAAGLDYVFGGAGVHHALGDGWTLSARAALASFQESAFKATGGELAVGLRYRQPGGRMGARVELVRSHLWGRNGAPAETTLQFGLTWALGPLPRGATQPRPFFAPADPVMQLVRRGFF